MVMTLQNQTRSVLLVALGLNLLILGVKTAVGILSGSLSILADALHSLTDVGSNFIALAAVAVASPDPDHDHPYGHQKFETLGAIGIVAFLLFACVEILQMAVERVTGGAPPVISHWTLGSLVCVLAGNIFITWYERREGERLNSDLLLADAEHTLSDVWVTVLVLVGMVAVHYGWAWADLVLCVPVAFFILQSARSILLRNVPLLVDQAALKPSEVSEVVLAEGLVVGCHDIATRGQVGKQLFIELHITVAPEMSVQQAHDLTERLEARLVAQFGPARITTHVEPTTVLRDPNHTYNLR